MVFWVDMGSGKRFQNFSMRANDSSHRKPIIELFKKNFWRKFGRKSQKSTFFATPVIYKNYVFHYLCSALSSFGLKALNE
jgi:hypothetical protein